MGSLGCPLCCQQDFGSVGALRDHLIYYIYRPLQCGVCSLHLEGVQEFTHHLKCHVGDGLPSAAKLSCPKPLPDGGESNTQGSPLLASNAAQDGALADPDTGIGTPHLTDGFSNYMKGGDAANQLLKLREWQLEKLGKNFSRHRASFGKSPGLLELSPASGRMHRSSPPVAARDLAHDRRPSSQNSCYTARTDVLSLGRSIDSVERCHFSTTPLSVYGNVSSVDLSDHGMCPRSVEKGGSEELNFHSPAQPVSPSHGACAHQSEQKILSTVKPMVLAGSHAQGMLISPISRTEVMPKNVNFQDCVPSESKASCDVDMNHQCRTAVSPSLYVLSAQEVDSCSPQSSRNELETLHDYNVCVTNFTEQLNKNPVIENNSVNIESFDSNKLPMFETMKSSEFGEDVCPSTQQYHKFQPVPVNREQLQPLTVNKEQLQPAPEVSYRLSDIWASSPSDNSAVVHKPLEVSNKSPSENNSDSYTLTVSNLNDIQDNCNSKTATYSSGTSNCDEETFHPEVMSAMTKNANADEAHEAAALKATKNKMHSSDRGNISALQCSGYEGQAIQEDGFEGPYFSSSDTKPYLHKKFHHDQERKVLPSAGVDQVADVSQYINSFQSVLVRKLNGTLSTNIFMTSSICSTSITKPEKDLSQAGLEPANQPQAKEYICEVCHQRYKNLLSLKSHCKEHEKEGENSCIKNLYRECPQDISERKCRRKDKFQCDQCLKVFPKAFSFARHMREVHAVKKSFSCLHCNKAFSSKRQLQEHSGIHKGKKVHECPQCHHLCYTASGLRTHIQEIHSNMEQRVYDCDVCGEKFVKIYGLRRHKQRKHTDQQLTCNICSKNFSCKEDFNKHNKTHLNANTLRCNNCDKTFSTSWALQRHSKTHQFSPRNFKCNICDSSFTRKDSLVSHLHAHSQKKPFICHCGKRFVKKSQLKEHQDKHSNVPKYTCPDCKHSFKFKVSLKNHSCKKK